MKRAMVCGVIVCAIIARMGEGWTENGTAFCVATDGSDANPGTMARPFASLEAARDAIRALKRRGAASGPITVWMRGGTYYRDRAFELTGEDAGTEEAPIVYRAWGREEVRLVGGREVPASSFKPVTDSAILERLDEAARGRVLQVDLKALGIADYGRPVEVSRSLELFCNGRRMQLARWPNEGFAPYGEEVEGAGPRFRYIDPRSDRWGGAVDLLVNGFWRVDWADETIEVEQVDTGRKEIALARSPGYGLAGGRRFYAFNLLEEIDLPGEWYLDRGRGVLCFWPPEDLERAEVLVSLLAEPFVSMQETSFVTLRGLTLEVARSTAVVIVEGEGNRVAGCTLRNVAGSGVDVIGGTRHGVLGCDIHDVGLKGVTLNGGQRGPLLAGGHSVENCHIHHFARHKKTYQPAVAISGVGNRVAHCLIHDAPHQAIAYEGNNHLIEFNEIHHVVLESGDAGVLYTGRDWTFRGNVVRHNFIHHIPSGPGYGTKGVYLDDCCSSTTIFGNVFYRMREAAFIGGGRDNRVENNLFIECEHPVHLDDRGLTWDYFRVDGPMYDALRRFDYRNPPWSTQYPELANILEETPQAPLGNTLQRNVSYRSNWAEAEKSWREVFRRHQIDERQMRIADNLVTEDDPGFVDPGRMDFRLREDSLVYRQIPAFRRIPFEAIGLYPDEYRTTWPAPAGPGSNSR